MWVTYGEPMQMTVLDDAFGHHVWATLQLLDVCIALTPEQLGTTVPGTYGSILDTQRHLVGADAWYLSLMAAGPEIDEDSMDLAELRASNEANGVAWSALLAKGFDPDEVIDQHHRDGSETHVTRSVLLTQALHHGTDHRSQLCTALTSLGIEPPFIDAWAYGEHNGRVVEVPAPS